MGFGRFKAFALLTTAAVALLPSPGVFAQLFQDSPDQVVLQTLMQNLHNPHLAGPGQVSSAFTSTIDQATSSSSSLAQITKPQQQNPVPDLDPSTGADPETTQQLIALRQRQEQERKLQEQREEQERQQQAQKELIRLQANQVLAQIQQAMQQLQQLNQRLQQQKNADALERFLSQLTDEQREAFQKRAEEAAKPAKQQIEDRAAELAWLQDFPYFRDGERTGSTPEWDDWWVTYQGLVVGTAGDDSSLTGGIHFDIHTSGELFGEMTFDGSDGSVTFEGLLDDLGGIDAQTGAGPNTFFGGVVPGQQGGAVLGSLYGPNAENAGGTWSFDVSGGERPGSVSGQFGAGRVAEGE